MHIAGLVIEEQYEYPTLPVEIQFADGGDRFVFDERVNVFIGPNASGKSSVLSAIRRDLPESTTRPASHDSRQLDLGTAETRRDGRLLLADWRFGQPPKREGGLWGGYFDFLPEKAEPVPVISVPAARLPARRNAELPTPAAFLAAAGHKMEGMTESEMANLMLTPSIDRALDAEQVQHAIELLISLAMHKSQNDAYDAFNRRLAAAKLVAGKDMENLMVQIKEVVRGGRSESIDIPQLAKAFGVSDVQISLAVSRLIEDGSTAPYRERYYEDLAIQASYSVDIDDEDTFMYASGVTSKAVANYHKAIGLSQICAKQICNEILSEERPQHISYQTTDVIQGVVQERLRTVHAMNVGIVPRWLVSDPPNPYGFSGELFATRSSQPLYELSAGTEMTLWWVRLIALNMLYHADFKFGWEKQPAILLIDEIENHLHPTWQRRVIPALLKCFPELQIFATTHSPFVVAGLKAGQVHSLKPTQLRKIIRGSKYTRIRTDDSEIAAEADDDNIEYRVYVRDVVVASSNTEDVVGWTMDEILRTLMGVDDPTDERTAAAARELRQLRDAGPSGDEQDEERRQARMQELRRLVDRDLLAGGPMAARRERFEQEFAAALEKYRQSQSLNQDGG